MSRTYIETVDYLMAKLPMFHRIGPAAFKKDLTNTIALCSALGNPQEKFPSIHVAGTNGKGSTTHLIASMLQSSGLKVGVYTSPHYIDFRERIKINGVLISEERIIEFVENHESLLEDIQPSFFEATVAMAFNYFAAEKVDIAVIEVGLGGRLDSTNIIQPLVSVITNIGYDHMQFLGNTLPEIAGEKAGIIKENIPVIIGERGSETDSVFTVKAKAEGASIQFAEDHIAIEIIAQNWNNMLIRIDKNNQPIMHEVKFPLLGNYQIKNLKTAVAAILALDQAHPNRFNISATSMLDGIEQIYKQTYFIGRWMVQSTKPIIIFDSAHNEHGLKPVFEQIKQISHKQLHIVFGTVSDKDLEKLKPLLPSDAYFHLCAADIPRAMPVEQLGAFFSELKYKHQTYPSVRLAYQSSKDLLGDEDILLVVGSIFILGEILGEE
ncbi:MAG: bifunctional folylpolyglutamate synthase/dihydrofolate synthase [Chitinophagales bacterium]|nr:bifunctional folylpolyglutamate synthase/dihydrofolate synthase [Chitinophagales bacterium]